MLANVVNACLGLFLAGAWAALQREKFISISQIKANRKQAYYLFATLFAFINILMIIIFGKICEIFSLLDSSSIRKGITIILFHSWPFNPFSYFGNGFVNCMLSSAGIFLLIIIWWSCIAAIVLFRGETQRRTHLILFGFYQVCGVFMLLEFYVLSRLVPHEINISSVTNLNYDGTIIWRVVAASLGMVLGLSIYVVTRVKFNAGIVTALLNESVSETDEQNGKKDTWNSVDEIGPQI